jgi:phosphoribosylformylglycinamidine synthase
VVVLLGDSTDELGGSEYFNVIHGLVRGVPPSLHLLSEAALQRLLVEGASRRLIRSAHDCAEGGLAVTLAECCFDVGLGIDVDVPGVETTSAGYQDIATLFGESASRAVISVTPDRAADLLALAAAEGVTATMLGTVGGDRIRISIDGRRALDEPLAAAERIWSSAIGAYFERKRAIA